MKRDTSLLMALVLLISMAIPAYATSDSPPYSLKYLQNIDGIKYVRYESIEDSDGLSDVTVEVYDVINLWMQNNGSWDATVRPFRDAFKTAGFEESVSSDTNEFDNQQQYTFTKTDSGQSELFLIYSEKRAQSILNESAIVYIHHARMAKESDTEQTHPSNENNTPVTQPGFGNFVKSASYESGRFADVNSNNWFEAGVKTAYELGLMKGNSATTFNPDGETTIAETLALACRIHSIYQGESPDFSGAGLWYQPYVDYAIKTGMIKSDEYSDYTKKATRANFANIIYASLPANTWSKINNIDSLPDVKVSDWFGAPVFALYNAGILTGSDKYGTFNPSSNIKRSEVATIVTRVAIPSARSVFTLERRLAANEFLKNYLTAKEDNRDNFGVEFDGSLVVVMVQYVPSDDEFRLAISRVSESIGIVTSLTIPYDLGAYYYSGSVIATTGMLQEVLATGEFSINPRTYTSSTEITITKFDYNDYSLRDMRSSFATGAANWLPDLLDIVSARILEPNGYSLKDLGFEAYNR